MPTDTKAEDEQDAQRQPEALAADLVALFGVSPERASEIVDHVMPFMDRIESDLSPDAREQVDRIAELVKDIVDRFGLTHERAAEIVDHVMSGSDPDIKTQD